MGRIKAVAAELTEQFHTADPFAICEHLDIEILWVDLPSSIKGFYSYFMDTRIIYLNSSLEDVQERRVVCAHELGHAMLHGKHNSLFLKETTDFVAARFEKEADLFAGYLLLDPQTVNDCRCNDWTYGQISQFTGLSEEVVEYCLTN
ncbi:ImmA/IrrE family metallo-endopeptidase [Oscillospiraceae bacterium PP1C4]